MDYHLSNKQRNKRIRAIRKRLDPKFGYRFVFAGTGHTNPTWVMQVLSSAGVRGYKHFDHLYEVEAYVDEVMEHCELSFMTMDERDAVWYNTRDSMFERKPSRKDVERSLLVR